MQRAVRAVPVGGLHDHDVGLGGGDGIPQDRPLAFPRSPEKSTCPATLLFQFQVDARRAQDVAGVDKSRAHAASQFQRVIVPRPASK